MALSLMPTLLSSGVLGQSRFETGDLKGFTKSPTEHIINRHEALVKIWVFEGTIVDPTGAPIPGAIVEVRGPGPNETVKGTVSDKRGRFKFGHLKEGAYAFKITFNGFQSVVGALRIARSAKPDAAFKVALLLGV
ncbi:MAG: carboxypeptidase-like regulatory domain-containing protein [Acidobacteriia bacterium]|nr:carboxypeptidase-like regulatory domain-containing protein [Terriglobia bacterium]